MNPEDFMRHAAALSRAAVRAGGEPFGTVIVRDGAIIAEGTNETARDPTAHAEIVAIRRACQTLGTADLSGCEMFTSCEPCPMCLGAIYWARLARLTFVSDCHDAAPAGFPDDVTLYSEVALPPEARRIPTRRLAVPDAAAVFAACGRQRRRGARGQPSHTCCAQPPLPVGGGRGWRRPRSSRMAAPCLASPPKIPITAASARSWPGAERTAVRLNGVRQGEMLVVPCSRL